MVTAVVTDDEGRDDIDPMQLRWAGVPRTRGFDPIVLARGDFAFLNVLERWGDDTEFVTFDDPDYDPGFPTSLSREFSHKVSVTITSYTAAPETIVIDVPSVPIDEDSV